MSSEDLKKDVESVTSSLANLQTGPWSRDLIDALGRMSALLPPTVQRDADSRPFFISPDLYLANLPFEAIDPDPDGNYRPLIETCDVAYLRSAETRPVRGVQPTHGIVVASPQYPATLRRRYPSLRSLPYGEKESALVAATFPGTLSLQKSHATKHSLSTHWESNSFIYVASHFIQSTETPYMSYLPLSAPEDAPLSDAMLDYGEIRKANLSGCALVVLSGCATGAAYTSARVAAPSLSDAFLDAGAEAVVHTRWRVLDDEAYELTQDFIARWHRGESVVVALNEARRQIWKTSAQNASTTWMSYAVTLSEIPSGSSHAERKDKSAKSPG